MCKETHTGKTKKGQKEALLARAAAMFTGDGAWERMIGEKDKINALMQPQFYSDKAQIVYRTDLLPAYPGMSTEQTENFLIGHVGIHAEFVNGPDCVVGMYQRNHMSLEESLKTILKDYDHDQSQYGVHCHKLFAGIALPGLNTEGKMRETPRQALSRAANEIEKWVVLNSDRIPQADQMAIHASLKHYRAALAEVNQFMDEATPFFGVESVKGKQNKR